MSDLLEPGSLRASDALGGVPVVGVIWAETVNGVIGKDGGMPWHLPEDLAHFRNATNGHPVVMGRRTWESFPARYRPLPGRTNIVVSSSGPIEGAVVVGSVMDALAHARQCPGAEEVWVIGGGRLYEAAMEYANAALVTVIESDADGDTFAPLLGHDWAMRTVNPTQGWSTSESTGLRYRMALWTRARA